MKGLSRKARQYISRNEYAQTIYDKLTREGYTSVEVIESRNPISIFDPMYNSLGKFNVVTAFTNRDSFQSFYDHQETRLHVLFVLSDMVRLGVLRKKSEKDHPVTGDHISEYTFIRRPMPALAPNRN